MRTENQHWPLVKTILKYIKGSMSKGTKYKTGDEKKRIHIHTDADYASDPESRRSVGGIVTMYSVGAIT